MYALLLGLRGSAGIGDVQHTYKTYDEEGGPISDSADIEEAPQLHRALRSDLPHSRLLCVRVQAPALYVNGLSSRLDK
jgi:hypothetical protein